MQNAGKRCTKTKKREGAVGGVIAGTLGALAYTMLKGRNDGRLAVAPPRMPHPDIGWDPRAHGIGVRGDVAAPAA